MITQKTAASGELAAGTMARRDALPFRLYDTTDLAKTQTARFDRQLSQSLDCVLTLADFEKSRLWGWLLGLYRRRLEKSIPL